MGNSVETQVEFVKLDRYAVQYWMLHNGKRYDDAPVWSDITHKARKKIADAKPGDIIEVVWNYDAASYPIVEARMITGSPEEEVRLLSERVKALEDTFVGLPKAMRRAANEIRGDRYEETQRVVAAMILAIESLVRPFERDGRG